MILPTCKEVAFTLARGDYDGAPWWRLLLLRAHLWHCELCRRYAAQLRLLAEAFREMWRRAPPAAQVAALERRLAGRLSG